MFPVSDSQPAPATAASEADASKRLLASLMPNEQEPVSKQPSTAECLYTDYKTPVLISAGVSGLAYGAHRLGSPIPAMFAEKALSGGSALLRRTPGALSMGVGAYGAGRFALNDLDGFCNADTVNDQFKYGLACLADLGMAGGAAARFSPTRWKIALPAQALSLAGRLAIDTFWEDTSSGYYKPDASAPEPQGISRHWVTNPSVTGGQTEPRGYDVYIPKGYDGTKPMPLMMVLHGVAAGNGRGLMEQESGMNSLADEKGFIVVYPYAKTHALSYTAGLAKIQDWNSPGSGLTEAQAGYDDVDYISSILKDLKNNKHIQIDQDEIRAVGFSSGGAFSQHLRGRLPNTFAGIGSVHGTLLGTEAKPQPGDKAAFISIHSDGDQMLPLNGGRGLMTLIFPRIADSNPLTQTSAALEANLGHGFPTVQVKDNVQITEYAAAQAGGFPVKEYIVQGGLRGGLLGGLLGRGKDGIPAGHSWDGSGKGGWPIVGDKNNKLNVSRVLVDELSKYKKESFVPARDLSKTAK